MSDKYYVTDVSGNKNNRRNTELLEYLQTFKYTILKPKKSEELDDICYDI